MDKEQSKAMELLIRTRLNVHFLRGVRVGIQTCSKVVLEKLNDREKTFIQRVDEVKKYCSTANQKEFLEKGISENSNNESIEDK